MYSNPQILYLIYIFIVCNIFLVFGIKYLNKIDFFSSFDNTMTNQNQNGLVFDKLLD